MGAGPAWLIKAHMWLNIAASNGWQKAINPDYPLGIFHAQAEGWLGGEKIPHIEGVQAEIGLQFFDPVLAIGPTAIAAPDLNGG